MLNYSKSTRALCSALSLALLFPLAAYGQQQVASPAPPGQELIAVLDLEAIGSDKVQASAMSDRLREELLNTRKYVLVNREQMDAVLNEQALQQTGCTSSECAVKVGKVLGVRKLVTGRVTKLDEKHWQLSANLVDVETAQTLRSASIQYEGDFFSLLSTGIGGLVVKLSGEQPSLQAMVQAAPPPAPAAAPAEPPKEEKKSSSLWWWIGGGVVVVAAVAAAGGSKGGGGGGSSSKTGTVGFSF